MLAEEDPEYCKSNLIGDSGQSSEDQSANIKADNMRPGSAGFSWEERLHWQLDLRPHVLCAGKTFVYILFVSSTGDWRLRLKAVN